MSSAVCTTDATGSRPRVLLVEDNENDELLARHALAISGFAVELQVVRDGEEALEVLLGPRPASGGPPVPPALVLLDLNLPKVDGLEVLRRLRASPGAGQVPVVILTSSADQRDLTRAYQQGARSYVCKPIEFDEFAAAMRLILSYWLTTNVSPPPPV